MDFRINFVCCQKSDIIIISVHYYYYYIVVDIETCKDCISRWEEMVYINTVGVNDEYEQSCKHGR